MTMLLSISTTRQASSDLATLLDKPMDGVYSSAVADGQASAHVFYIESSPERVSAVLYVDVRQDKLVRKSDASASFALERFINDRPYSANIFLSIAITEVFDKVLNGVCEENPQLVAKILPLEIEIPALFASRHIVELLFQPLGYALEVTEYALDDAIPAWGRSPYITVRLKAELCLLDAMRHLFTLLPVLDNKKHLWVAAEKLDKLFEKGGDWFSLHPAKELIARRYLKYKSYADVVLERLNENIWDDDNLPLSVDPLGRARMERITELLLENDVDSVIDLGCGEGKYLVRFMLESRFRRIAGMDVSHKNLEKASERLHLDGIYGVARERIKVFQGSLTYHDDRLRGYDAAIAVEVIEHMEPSRLDSFERAVFMCAAPRVLIVTTPNKEYNDSFDRIEEVGFVYPARRFEWTRAEFEGWAMQVAMRHNYSLSISFVGEEKPDVGAASQLALFIREE